MPQSDDFKKISPFATMIVWLIIAIAFFTVTLINLHSIVRSDDNRIVLNNLRNDKNGSVFGYHILKMDEENIESYSMSIPDSFFWKLANQREPYKLIMYRIACNWYKIWFNDTLIGTHGNSADTNSIIWNGSADFEISPNLIKENNIIRIELFGEYEIGSLSFLPFITDMKEGCRIIGWLQFITGFYIIAIGILLLCFLLLLLLSTMMEQKNLAYLSYAIATCLAAISIGDSITIPYLSISLLTFKKLIYTAIYCSIATYSLAIHFHFNRKSPLIFAIILYALNLLLIFMSSNTIVIRKLAVICHIGILANAICWIYITLTEKNKHAEAKIICVSALFFMLTAFYDIFFMFAHTESVYNFLCANIFGALFFSIAIVLMIFGEYVKMHGTVITEKARVQRLYDKSIRDPMTAVFNKGYMTSTLKSQTDMYSIIMIDADKFKSINDTYGHESGDEVIIRIANTCTQNVRDDDIVCREGGDEFVIILPTCNEATATSIASNILKSFREPFKLKNGTTLTMSLSIGVYCNSTGTVDYIQALRFADQAQYAVKQNGRNNVLCYSQAIRSGLIPKEME